MSDRVTAGSCPWCGSGRWRPGPVRGELAYRVCRRCRSGWLPDDVLAFREYYEEYDPSQVRDLPEILRNRYQAILARLEARAPGRSLLEVGCGNGHFLLEARARGWEVAGVELSRAHVARAREAGLEVRYGDLGEDGLWTGRTFDAVVAIEVVEHVPRPRDLLGSCTERLRPGGVLYLTTPNFGSISRRLLGPGWSVLSHEHVALASPAGLRAALETTGHRVLSLRSKSIFLSEYVAAFRRWRGERRWRAAARADAGSASPEAPPRPGGEGERVASTAALRDRIESSSLLRGLKSLANWLLALTGLGEGLESLSMKMSADTGESS